MKAFLSETVERILKDPWPLHKTIWVFPSKRAGTFAKNHLRSHISKTEFAPKFYSIEDFVAQLSMLSPTDSETALCILYESYLNTEIKDKDSFSSFLPWGTTLLQDFNEIDRYGVNAQKLYTYIQNLQEVSHWALDENKTPLVKNYLSFWEELPGLYRSFTAKMLENGMGHQGLLYKKAAENLNSFLETNPDKKIFFIGFNALNNSESQIIQEIINKNAGSIYWDIDSYFLKNTYHEAGYYIRKHHKEWPQFKDKTIEDAIQGISNNYTQNKKIQLYGVPKSVSQAHLIGQILSEMNKDTLQKTAVVLGNESLLKPLIHCLPEHSPANITMGASLSECSMAHFFAALYELQSSGEQQGWYFEHLAEILKHPYARILIHTVAPKGADKLLQYLAKTNQSYAALNILIKELPEARDVLALFFKDVSDSAILFLKQLKACCEQLYLVASERKQTNLRSETLYFLEIFESLETQLITYPFIKSIKGLWRLYSERLHKIKIPYSGEALSGLQIMGMLESRNLDFETLIISDVNEGILPGGKTHNSFIPLSLKREFGLPTFKEKDAVYAYHFYRLLQRAKEVYLIYNTATDALEGGEPSRFIYQLKTQKIAGVQVKDTLVAAPLEPIRKQPYNIKKGEDIIAAITKKGTSGFSPSALNTYIRNPIDFYKKYVLKIEEPHEVEEIIAYNTFGNIVHESLDLLYKNYVGFPLKASHFDEIREQIPIVLAQKYEKNHGPLKGARGKNIIAHRVILQYLKDFISFDKKIAIHETLEIVSLEKKYAIALEIAEINAPINFYGKIDRVHRRNGVLEILDFKTGMVSQGELKVKDWKELSQEPKLAKALQLVTYAMLYQAEHPKTEVKAGIYSFKNTTPGIMYFENGTTTENKQLITKSTIEELKKTLAEILLEIYNIEIPFVEKEV